MAPRRTRVTKIVSRVPILGLLVTVVLAVPGAKSLLQRPFAVAAASLARPGADLALLCQESSGAGPLPCILAATVFIRQLATRAQFRECCWQLVPVP